MVWTEGWRQAAWGKLVPTLPGCGQESGGIAGYMGGDDFVIDSSK